jgi:cyclopropane fatty-acyl-phospholipid synthase-like methyltransferase
MGMSETPDLTGGWDRKYANSPSLFGDCPNGFLVARQAGFLPGQKVLVIADGSGRHGAWLAGLGLKVDAFDISPEANQQAQDLDARLGVTVHRAVCGWEGWPKWEGYDHIVAIFIQFSPPEERTRLFARMRSALVSGGTLHLLGYAEAQLGLRTGGPSDLERLYSRELLMREFSGMTVEVLAEYRAELSEGTAHRGPSALIGLVARAS